MVSYSHQTEDIDRTIAAVQEIAPLYARALADGPERYTDGRPVKPVFRKFN